MAKKAELLEKAQELGLNMTEKNTIAECAAQDGPSDPHCKQKTIPMFVRPEKHNCGIRNKKMNRPTWNASRRIVFNELKECIAANLRHIFSNEIIEGMYRGKLAEHFLEWNY